jgi:hypothetical protein
MYGCAVALVVLGLLIGGSACSPSPQLESQPVSGAAPGQMKTLAIVAINSYEKLMADVTFTIFRRSARFRSPSSTISLPLPKQRAFNSMIAVTACAKSRCQTAVRCS